MVIYSPAGPGGRVRADAAALRRLLRLRERRAHAAQLVRRAGGLINTC